MSSTSELDLEALGFSSVVPEVTGPAGLSSCDDFLKIYLYGYLNRIQSSRRLDQETQHNGIELMSG